MLECVSPREQWEGTDMFERVRVYHMHLLACRTHFPCRTGWTDEGAEQMALQGHMPVSMVVLSLGDRASPCA